MLKRFIKNNLDNVKHYSNELSSYNLSYRGDVKVNDEFGQVITELNNSVDSLSTTMSEVKASGDEIFKSSEEIDTMLIDISSSLEEVTAAVEQISANMEESLPYESVYNIMLEFFQNPRIIGAYFSQIHTGGPIS